MSDLVVSQLSKVYPSRGEEIEVLRGVSLRLSPGENLAIMGPSGTGKSTLLHILGTLDRPTSGSVRLGEEDPFALSEEELARFRAANLGFIFQDHHLLPQLTVLENVLVPALAAGRPADGATDRARQLLERVGLEHRLSHLPSELSGGEKERVAVARALLNRPRVVLADEPTGNLDRRTAERIGQLLVELPREEQTILVVVTHSQQLADQLDRRAELMDGQLVDQQREPGVASGS